MSSIDLVFVIPILHPGSADSYDRAWCLLEDTVNSCSAQIKNNFRVVVVGNELVREFEDDRCEFVKVSYPPADQSTIASAHTDKGAKRCVGVLHSINKYTPNHIMFVDADDYVGNDISDYVSRNLNEPGWYVPTGYFYVTNKWGTKLLYKRSRFQTLCGTSHILNTSLLSELIGTVDLCRATSDIDYVVNRVSESVLLDVLSDHQAIRKIFEDSFGATLLPYPTRSCVRVCNTGENHSRHVARTQDKLSKLRFKKRRVPTKDQIEYFSIPAKHDKS